VDGLTPIPEWHWEGTAPHNSLLTELSIDVDYAVANVFYRLRNIFNGTYQAPLPTTRLHDLTCFVIHRLLLTPPDTVELPSSLTTECLRYALILYMFIIHGPTYYSHAAVMDTIFARFLQHLKRLHATTHIYASYEVWLLSIGLVASTRHTDYQWLTERAKTLAASLQLGNWDDAFVHIRRFLWLQTPQGEAIFRPPWHFILCG
jgi:hypothetical protein